MGYRFREFSIDPLTPQQQMLLDRDWRSYAQVEETRRQLDDKLAAVLQISGVTLGLAGLLGIFGSDTISALTKVCILLTVAAFGLMVSVTLYAIRPQPYTVIGRGSWEDRFEKMLHRDADDAYAGLILSLHMSIQDIATRNAAKVRLLWASLWILLLQLSFIFIAIGDTLLGPTWLSFALDLLVWCVNVIMR